MGIFSRRPLCLFCFLFLAASYFAWNLSNSISLLFIAIFLLCSVLLLILSFKIKKAHVKLTTLFVCSTVVTLAILHSFLFIGIPRENAKAYVGKETVSCYVIGKEYSGEYSDTYYVKLKKVNDTDVNIKADLVCYFKSDLNPGDVFYAPADISDDVSTYSQAKGRLLTVYVENKDQCYVRYTSERSWFATLFSECGIEIVSNKLTNNIEDILVSEFGEEKGTLAMGFFTGERSGIPPDITRDFRRAGISHLMAISGSHIAILLGTIDILLQKLLVDKKYRCIIVTVFSIAFLFIAGFSLSACRSVFMLYAVYLAFLFYEDDDSITSLFVSVTLIVAFSPHSIMDLGLIMSFLATLGLLTAYPVFEQKIPYPRKKRKLLRRILVLLRQALLIALMTVVANAYLLPIIWWFFGEFSIVSVIGNILIAPISSVFLLLIPIHLLIYGIPVIGHISNFAVSLLAELTLFIVRLCSKLPNATVSLKYEFCFVIIIIFTVSMAVLLIVKLKRKYLIALPMAFAVIAYSICFAFSSLFYSQPTLTYMKNGKNEALIVKEGITFSVCDISSSASASYSNIMNEYDKSNATNIQAFVLTHYHSENINVLEMIMQETIVRQLYLPKPSTSQESKYAQELWNIAKSNGVDIIFYDDGERIDMTKTVVLNAVNSASHEKGSFLAFVSENDSVVYASPYYNNKKIMCSYLIEGQHGAENVNYECVKYVLPLN